MNTGQTLVLAVTAIAMVTNWWSRLGNRRRVEMVSKPLATMGTIGLALVSGAPHSTITWAVVALALCLAGDVALLPAVDRFVVGLGAFLAGHLAFIVVFVKVGAHHPRWGGLALIALALMITTVGRVIVFSVSEPALRKPVLGYLVVISAMACVGWATANPWIAVGSTAFVVSDAVLGWGQFVREKRWMPITIMVTYHVAIGCLALSLW